jgi:hypothetical protein
MIELTETTFAMALASLGVVGTVIWYALAWYGLSTLRDIRDAVDQQPSNSE